MGANVDIRIATGKSETADGGVPHGALLRRFATAVLHGGDDLVPARKALSDAVGDRATAQAASIIGCFDGLNRVADATGIRLDPESEATGAAKIIETLEFEALGAARA